MEIKLSERQILKLLNVLAWILFLGICVETGSYIFNACYSMMVNSVASHYFGLYELYNFNAGNYITLIALMTIVGTLKVLMFYSILKLLDKQKLNLNKPFNTDLYLFMRKVSYLSLGIGLFSFWGRNFMEWFIKKGIVMPTIERLSFGGADVWIFMWILLYVVAHILKRGVAIQTENDLTI